MELEILIDQREGDFRIWRGRKNLRKGDEEKFGPHCGLKDLWRSL
jgi:hypothetical protein